MVEGGMDERYNPEGLSYDELSARLYAFLEEDRVIGPTVSTRRRLAMLNRAVNQAEAGISRLDPLFSEVWARYITALERASPKSAELHLRVGIAIDQPSLRDTRPRRPPCGPAAVGPGSGPRRPTTTR
jgi:hypothetical protein